jgi:cysteine desulfurase
MSIATQSTPAGTSGIGHRQVYLDYAATTPLDSAVLETMLPYLTHEYGNAASPHAFGQRASRAVDRARDEVSDLVGAEPEELIFTSGATESINLVIKGVAASAKQERPHLITAATEHKAVLDTARALEAVGVRVTVLPVDCGGLISLADLETALKEKASLVSLMAANNETGTLGPVNAAANLAHAYGALMHTDATQLVGKLPANVDDLGVDFLSFSAHKMYGPKGIGALYVRRGRRGSVVPLMHGGGHEFGLRSGTLNVPGCVGFGRACVIARARVDSESTRLAELRDQFERQMQATANGVSVNGYVDGRLPGISNLHLEGVDADSLVLALPDVAVASGSACTSATPAPSHVLRAMGVGYDAASESIRVSLGRFTTDSDIAFAVGRIAAAAEVIRDATPGPVEEEQA